MSCGNSLLGGNTTFYIKVGNGEFIAVEGATTAEKLGLSELRMPYKQIIKGRVILKPGQSNYLLNFLGLGDNATFLAIKVIYDKASVIEKDNYLTWCYYDGLNNPSTMCQMLVLTGNSSNRIKQLYISNPNTKYGVTLEIMVGLIDDSYYVFNDVLNQYGTTFVNLDINSIKTHIVNESIKIIDSNLNPLLFIQLNNIQSIQKSGKILIIDDSTFNNIYLDFLTEYDANQVNSLLNYVLSNQNININGLNPLEDNLAPVVYFNSNVGATSSGDFIYFNGSTASLPYDTSYGYTFSTSMSLTSFGLTNGTASYYFDNSRISDLIISNIIDNRDGVIISDNLIIASGSTSGSTQSYITTSGTYSVMFDIADIAGNKVNAELKINILP